ncbi:YkvA family protein [Frankia sp. Cas3]|uniref:YkvA family protein n=1 Tax=Frankia sp. Cas3 TaxID=3073926 RepID=UPI002AD22BB5|nr:DUF1232 domain-containing protein [Frankia sp. Cas3]
MTRLVPPSFRRKPMVSLDKDAAREVGREIATFVPDLVVMLRRVLVDPRVSQSAKMEAAASLAYLISPRNRLTNLIPVVGQLDDIALVAFAFRRLQMGAGEAILREHWRGSDRTFQVMIGASSALSSPRGMIRRVKLARTLAESTMDRLAGSRRRHGMGDAPHRVIEGEVIDGDRVRGDRVKDDVVDRTPASEPGTDRGIPRPRVARPRRPEDPPASRPR